MNQYCKDCGGIIKMFDDGFPDSDGFGECQGCGRLFQNASDFRNYSEMRF